MIIWKSSVFSGFEVFQNSFAIFVEFSLVHNGDPWILTSVYGPCETEGKVAFIEWFENIHMPDEVDWLIVGDFNLYRIPQDRNRPGGNVADMLLFNGAISALGVVEIPLYGRKYTWTNKQQPHLWKDLIGSLVLGLGLPNTPTQMHILWLWRSLIIGPVCWKLKLQSPKEESSDLKIVGWSMTAFC